MTGLACYWLKPPNPGAGEPLDQFTDTDQAYDAEVGPIVGHGYRSKLFVAESPPHELPWVSFLRQGFGDPVAGLIPLASGAAALLVLEVEYATSMRYFAIPFGFGGRHLLRSGCWSPGYGIRTALNLIYPNADGDTDGGRLIAFDSKQRSVQTIRSRRQSSRATTFEAFDLDRLRDVIGAATGTPADPTLWGRRVTGGDAIYLNLNLSFGDLPELCRRLIDTYNLTDYRQQFAWLDNVQPVADRDRLTALQQRVLSDLMSGQTANLELSPPEIVDWTRVDGFSLHYAKRKIHPDLRLADYLRGADLDDMSIDDLKHRYIFAVDGDGNQVYKWSVWRCLQGELAVDDHTIILDEGEFVQVSESYLADLDNYIQRLPEPLRTTSSSGKWRCARASVQHLGCREPAGLPIARRPNDSDSRSGTV